MDHVCICLCLAPTARLSSSAGYAFVHMERKEDAQTAIEALNGTTFKGRPLSVELSKIQPSKPVTVTCTIPCVTCGKLGHYAGDCPAGKASKEHHQSQAAVLAAAAAAAAGLPLQVCKAALTSPPGYILLGPSVLEMLRTIPSVILLLLLLFV